MKSSRFSSRSACAITSAGGFASSSRVRKLRYLFVRAGIAFAQLALDRFQLLRRYALRCASVNCDFTSSCNFCWICAISSCAEM